MSVILIDCIFESFCSQLLLGHCIKELRNERGGLSNTLQSVFIDHIAEEKRNGKLGY